MSAALALQQVDPAAPQRLQLSRLLRDADVPIRALAQYVGVDERSVHRWTARVCRPSFRFRSRIAAFLKLHGIDPRHALEPEAHPMSDLYTLPPPRLSSGGPAPQSDMPDMEPPMEIASREPLDDDTLAHFGLADDPFADIDDPTSVWMSGDLQRVENRLLRVMKDRQIFALCGDPGSGKSTLIRRVRARLADDTRAKVQIVSPASLDRRRLTSTALVVALVRDLAGEDTSSWPMEKRSSRLQDVLADFESRGVLPVVMIDEAHHLSNNALLAIKQVWDSYLLFRMLAVVLVGQLSLQARLKTDGTLRELTGRTVIGEVPRLGANTGAYLRWRCTRTGADADKLFSADAIKAIATRGEYPLWINNLATRALQKAHQVGDTQVTGAHVGRV